MAYTEQPNDAVPDSATQGRRFRYLRDESADDPGIRSLHCAATVVDLGFGKDGPAFLDWTRKSDMGASFVDRA